MMEVEGGGERERERKKGGFREGNEVQGVHLFSVEAVAESSAVGVCC